jgi:hypothetical protein
MNKYTSQKELENLHSIFSKNEERITQLEHRENYLQSKIKRGLN